MIVCKDCIEFSMEICSEFTITPESEQKLKEKLKIMHALRIVHRDIKPDNIMWSNTFNGPVFIDFGGAKFIKEPLGQRSPTKFIGTIGYVSEDMFKVLNEKKPDADLYYNDVYGLKISIKYLYMKNEKN